MLSTANGLELATGAWSGDLSPKGPEKKRRVTHADKKMELVREIELLQSGVEVLKTRGLQPQSKVQRDNVLQSALELRAALVYAMQKQQLHVAKMQSALSRYMMKHQYFPLHGHIHLGKDPVERRAALLAMREEKLSDVLKFMLDPERITDPLKPHFSENKFETADGDLCCIRYETVPFPGVKSLAQVMEALSFYKTNMEFIISDQLGHVATRDDYVAVDGRAFNTRMISTDQNGVTNEGNVVSFRHMFGTDGDKYDGEPCAVLAVDTVEEDELYPYLSSERVRRDISSGILLTASTPASGELVVTMRRAVFLQIRRPEFPLPPHALEDIRDGIMEWLDALTKTLRGIVYPIHQQSLQQ